MHSFQVQNHNCNIHTKEPLVSVCTLGSCNRKGAICPYCQVLYHTEHLEYTWNLDDYLRQVDEQISVLHPGTFELNDFLKDFKNKIGNARIIINKKINKIENLVGLMIDKAKQSFDKDIDDVKNILKNLNNFKRNNEFLPKVLEITKYFGLDPDTHEVYRSKAYGELYKWKTKDLLMEQMEYFDSQISLVTQDLNNIEISFNEFQIPNIDSFEVPKFKPENFEICQNIESGHSNWIRGIQMFQLSDLEVQNLNLSNIAQMAKREPHKPDGLLAIVTNGDDMAVKIWVYFPEFKGFKMVSEITQAHSREFLSMRIQYCDEEQLSRMGGSILCNNIIFTGEHGLIKLWDWIQKKCLNEIKTYSVFCYDFEVLRFPRLGVCFAQGSKNIIQVCDFTSPGGILKIKEIYPEEQHKEITSFKKIPVGQMDILVVALSTIPGIIKVYNYEGKCIVRILRQDKELAFCIEHLMSLKRSEREKISDDIIVGSDAGILSAYSVNDGKTLWINSNVHNSWIRGLTSFVVKDSYSFKSLVLSTAEMDLSIKVLEGSTGQFLHEIKDAFDSGLRFRSFTSFQGKLDPKLPDSTVIVGGTMKGTITIIKMFER